jgi:hypothetical protein
MLMIFLQGITKYKFFIPSPAHCITNDMIGWRKEEGSTFIWKGKKVCGGG